MKTRFILIETSHAGNVGACARAMKTMGFDDLVLVAPRYPNVLNRDETIQRASGALDVLKNAKILATIDEALSGIEHLCATTMITRDFGPPTNHPREYFAHLNKNSHQQSPAAKPQSIAFLFGSERFGMKNEDVYRCHTALSIPSDPQFGSLNLASALQLIAYEWRLALGGFDAPCEASRTTVPADAKQITGLIAHWEKALIALDFLDSNQPKKLMPRINQILNRTQLDQKEIDILRGIAAAILKRQ